MLLFPLELQCFKIISYFVLAVKLVVSGTAMVIHPGSTLGSNEPTTRKATSSDMISQPSSAVACVQRVGESVCDVDGQPCSNTSQDQTVGSRKVKSEVYNRQPSSEEGPQSCLETEEGSLALINREYVCDVSQCMTHKAEMDYPSNTSETAVVSGAENKTISLVVCACCSGNGFKESAFSAEQEVECKVSSVSIEESVRPAEAPQTQTSPGVYSRVSPQTSIFRHQKSVERVTKTLEISPRLYPQASLLSELVSLLSGKL